MNFIINAVYAAFVWLASGSVALFYKFFTSKVFSIALIILFTTFFVSIISAYISSGMTIINAIGATMPEVVAGVYGWVAPSNINALILAVVSCKLLRFFTDLYLYILDLRVRAFYSN